MPIVVMPHIVFHWLHWLALCRIMSLHQVHGQNFSAKSPIQALIKLCHPLDQSTCVLSALGSSLIDRDCKLYFERCCFPFVLLAIQIKRSGRLPEQRRLRAFSCTSFFSVPSRCCRCFTPLCAVWFFLLSGSWYWLSVFLKWQHSLTVSQKSLNKF